MLRWLTAGLRHGRRPSPASSTPARSSSSSRSTRTACAMTSPASPYRAWRKNRQKDARGQRDVHGPQPQLRVPLGLLRRLVGQAQPRSPTAGPAPFSAPETRAIRDFVNSRVIGGVQQIRTHITLHTNGELILWPYGYTKTNVPPDMTTLDHTVVRVPGQGHGRAATATRPSSRPTCTSPTATRSTGCTPGTGSSRYTFELYPTEKPTVWGDHYPDDSQDRPPDRPQPDGASCC